MFRDSYALARLIPDGVEWSVTITDAEGIHLPVAFNVFVKDNAALAAIRNHLGMTCPEWTEPGVEEYKYTPRVTLGLWVMGDHDAR